jgi:putative spermidine/putrescine transport system permease protein
MAGLFPAMAVFLLLFFGAVGLGFIQSLGYAPQYGVNTFPTLQYYDDLLSDSGFWASLGLTFYYAIVPTVIGAGISLVLSVFLAKRFPGRPIALFIYKIPMVVPYLVGVSLVILLFANGGIFARGLYALNIISAPSEFPRIIQSAEGWGIMLVYLWKQVPFMTLILYANLLVLGRHEEESALLLGASSWQIFCHVTIPRLVPALVSGTLIVFAFNFGSFEVPYILGAGYPNTLTVEAWRLFDDPDYTNRPTAMALVSIVGALSGLILFIYLSLYRRYEKSRGR